LKEDFITFQETYKRYQKLFGLSGYKVYFKHKPLEDVFADTTINNAGHVVTVRLNSRLPPKAKIFKDVTRTAKHEAIHLLLDGLESRALSRYIRDGEVSEEVENLVFKLEELIP
jgi:hypothetical protein